MKTINNPVIIGLISSVIIGGGIFIMFQTIISGPLILPSHNWNATIVTPGLKELNSTEMAIKIKNQTYYFDTLNDTITAYHNDPVQILFHDVVFTLLPSPYSGGPPGSCGGNNFRADTKFPDGVHESLNIFVQSQPCLGTSTPVHLSNHTHPQSGLIFYDRAMKLLVSTTIPDSAEKRASVGTARVLGHSSPVQLLDMYGNDSSSIASANLLSGLSAKIPTYLPSDLGLETIKTSDSFMVTLFYLPKQLSLDPRTTLDDVLTCNGLVIVNTKEPPLDRAKWIQDNIAAGDVANEIIINGQRGIGSDGVPQNGMESTVAFYDGNTQVELLSTRYSESELIKIAESLHAVPAKFTSDNSIYSHPAPSGPIDNGFCCDYNIPIIAATLGSVSLLVIFIHKGKIRI